MPVTVAEALKMEVFQECRLLTAEAGLSNIISWVNILEILDDLTHIEPGELLITTAHGFNNQNRAEQEKMIKLFAAKKLAAVAIQTGHYVQSLPPSFIALAKSYKIPVIEIPAHISFKNITRALISRLIKDEYQETAGRETESLPGKIDQQVKRMKYLWTELANTDNPKDYHLELSRFNLEVKEPVSVALISFKNNKTGRAGAKTKEHDDLIKLAGRSATALLQEMHIPFLLGSTERLLTLLIQCSFKTGEPAVLNSEIIIKVVKELKKILPGHQMQAGISAPHKDISGFKQALSEAEKALRAVESGLLENRDVLSYRDLGLYRLIMDIKNMETLISFYNETAAPLLQYDRQSEGALLKTLCQYMQVNSIKRAAEKLYIHRHTMKYRLEQVHKLTGLNPLEPSEAFKLNIGLHIYQYLKALRMLP